MSFSLVEPELVHANGVHPVHSPPPAETIINRVIVIIIIVIVIIVINMQVESTKYAAIHILKTYIQITMLKYTHIPPIPIYIFLLCTQP